MCAASLLATIILLYAILFTQAAVDAGLSTGGSTDLVQLQERFGTLSQSYWNLFKCISGGTKWEELATPLANHTHWTYTIHFVVFIGVVLLGIMNVITSLFVDGTLTSMQHLKSSEEQAKTVDRDLYVRHLKEMFDHLDHEKRGTITATTMRCLFESKCFQDYMEMIEVRPEEARALLVLLDKDHTGMVAINDFCTGVLKLKGDAKNYDIYCLLYENQRLMHKCQQHMDYLETGFLPKMVRTVKRTIEVATPGGTPTGSRGLSLFDGDTPVFKVSGQHYTVNLTNCSGTLSGTMSSPASPPPVSKPTAHKRVHVPNARAQSQNNRYRDAEPADTPSKTSPSTQSTEIPVVTALPV